MNGKWMGLIYSMDESFWKKCKFYREKKDFFEKLQYLHLEEGEGSFFPLTAPTNPVNVPAGHIFGGIWNARIWCERGGIGWPPLPPWSQPGLVRRSQWDPSRAENLIPFPLGLPFFCYEGSFCAVVRPKWVMDGGGGGRREGAKGFCRDYFGEKEIKGQKRQALSSFWAAQKANSYWRRGGKHH